MFFMLFSISVRLNIKKKEDFWKIIFTNGAEYG